MKKNTIILLAVMKKMLLLLLERSEWEVKVTVQLVSFKTSILLEMLVGRALALVET